MVFAEITYDRLRINYTKHGWFLDAIRACKAYIELPEPTSGQEKESFHKHIAKLTEKLNEIKFIVHIIICEASKVDNSATEISGFSRFAWKSTRQLRDIKRHSH
jgi:hypothetical protein